MIEINSADKAVGRRDYAGEFLKFLYNASPDFKMAQKFREVMRWAVK